MTITISRNPLQSCSDKASNLLNQHDVVVADKNNHLEQPRRDTGFKYPQLIRLLALNWSLDQPPATIHRICGDMSKSAATIIRHCVQTHQPNLTKKLTGCSSNLEAFSLSEVDDIVRMEIGEPMEDSVRRPVEGVLGLEIPSDEKIEGALDLVKEYASAIKTLDDPREKKSINYV